MAKPNLLGMVQDILSTLDGDTVNSISDTYEATQIARQIRTTYKELAVEYNLGAHEQLVSFSPFSDPDFPTFFHIPEDMSEVKWIKYNKDTDDSPQDNYSEVKYLDPKAFIEYTNNRNSLDANVQTVLYGVDEVKLYIYNDRHPTYWTTFDDEVVVMDSFNSQQDTTLQQSKMQAMVQTMPPFVLTDLHVPDLPQNLFPLLYKTSEARCYAIYKQTDSPRLAMEERWQRIRAQRTRYNAIKRNLLNREFYGRQR